MSNPLENELKQMTPVMPSEAVEQRIYEALEHTGRKVSMRLADRVLLGTMSAGLAAACVIVALMASDYVGGRQHAVSEESMAQVPNAMVENQRMLAQLTGDSREWISQWVQKSPTSTAPF